jgi:hypothetical protein
MVSLNYYQGPPCPTPLHPAGGQPLKRPYGCFRGGSPTAVVYRFGHPTPYAYASLPSKESKETGFDIERPETRWARLGAQWAKARRKWDNTQTVA